MKFPEPPSASAGKPKGAPKGPNRGPGFSMSFRHPETDITYLSSDKAPLLHLKTFLQEEKRVS